MLVSLCKARRHVLNQFQPAWMECILKYKICWLAPTRSWGNVAWMELAHSGYLVRLWNMSTYIRLSALSWPAMKVSSASFYLCEEKQCRSGMTALSLYFCSVNDCFLVVCGNKHSSPILFSLFRRFQLELLIDIRSCSGHGWAQFSSHVNLSHFLMTESGMKAIFCLNVQRFGKKEKKSVRISFDKLISWHSSSAQFLTIITGQTYWLLERKKCQGIFFLSWSAYQLTNAFRLACQCNNKSF